MKQFFITFFICLFPILLLCEVVGLVLPQGYPYGIVIISKLFAALIGIIIAITRLRKKYQLVSFGKSLLAGSIVIFTSSIIGLLVYTTFQAAFYRESMGEVLTILGSFAFAQIGILLMVLMVAGMCYVFQKAGQKGYAIFIPIYSALVMLDIAKKPRWWFFMFLIPIANIVFAVKMLNGISKNFGKDEGFTVGLVFLNGIFWAILGYGDAVYLGTNRESAAMEDILDA